MSLIAGTSKQTSRRNFLRSGVALTLGLSLPTSSWLAGCRSAHNDPTPIWDQLASQLSGPLLRPENPAYKTESTLWALQYASARPQAIAMCASEADVQTCLQWARTNAVPLVARSGGHSYGGYSTSTGLVINVSQLTNFAHDPASNRITVGGGVRNRLVYEKCKPLGRAITHGRCYGVGVAGLVLGGGIGFNMRNHGYTCDQLRETRIVLADGRILTCNETQNADLFWACRGGGGGNFGIHTSFTFDTFEVGTITVFNLRWKDRLPETFTAIQTMALAAPKSLGLKLSVKAVQNAGKTELSLEMLGQLAGPVADLNALLMPILSRYPATSSTINEKPYWDGQADLSDEGLPEYAHERSRFVKGQLSAEAIRLLFKQLSEWPGTSRAATWKYFLLGGAVDARKSDDMAFIHRGYSMLSSIDLEWSEADSAAVVSRNQQWLNQFHDQMEPYTSSACYQNFVDPSQQGYLNAYYGQHLSRLQAVKRKYDPNNLFSYPQSIPV